MIQVRNRHWHLPWLIVIGICVPKTELVSKTKCQRKFGIIACLSPNYWQVVMGRLSVGALVLNLWVNTSLRGEQHFYRRHIADILKIRCLHHNHKNSKITVMKYQWNSFMVGITQTWGNLDPALHSLRTTEREAMITTSWVWGKPG